MSEHDEIDGVELEGSELDVVTPTGFQSGQEIDGVELEGSELNVVTPTGFQFGQEIDGVELEGSEFDVYVGELGTLRLLKAELEPDVDQPGMGTQFMILNQYQTLQSETAKVTNIYNYYDDDLNGEIIGSSSYDYQKNKDIIWYGRAGVYANSINESSKLVYQQRTFDDESEFFESKYGLSYDSVYPVQLNSKGFVGTNLTELSFYTGSIRIAAPLKSVSITKNSFAIPLTRTNPLGGIEDEDKRFTIKRSYMFGETLGGRNLFDVTNGRSYVGGVVGGDRSENFDYKSVTFEGYNVEDKISPYVLMPDDKLLILCAHQPGPYDISDYITFGQIQDQPSIESNTAELFRTKLRPGIGKVAFYGSYLRDGQPVEPESSQPLTSMAVHEDVKGGISPYGSSFCSDQFQLEPSTTFRKNYVDRLYEGSIFNGGPRNDFSDPDGEEILSRRLIELSVDGGVQENWSLQRFVRLFNSKETYYDSHVPFLQQTLNSLGISVDDDGKLSLESKLSFFPFEPQLANLPRSLNVEEAVKGSTAQTRAFERFEFTSGSFEIDSQGLTLTNKQLIALIHGFGDSLDVAINEDETNVLRGSRYGLMNLYPKSLSAVFRHDRYGQFRDMLETSFDSAFFGETDQSNVGSFGLVESPIKIRFVERKTLDLVRDPEDTNSQNISVFATSSLPYFDELSFDRIKPEPDLNGNFLNI